MNNYYDGPSGWAQRATWPPGLPGTECLVDLWYLRLPNQAPGNAWDSYCMGAVHLRPVEGVDAPIISEPFATHEMYVFALEPGSEPTDPIPWRLMSASNIPGKMVPNVAVQFRCTTDERAMEVIELCARACVQGRLAAETGIYMFTGEHRGKMMAIKHLIDDWINTVRTTAHHMETGGHHGALN